jgi:chorismate dehydratase
MQYAVPSELVPQLRSGALDLAMASTFVTLCHPELHLLPGLGVTVSGPAWSVRLISKVPLPQIRTLALDSHSRSTVVLARIILADSYGVTPTVLSFPPDLDFMLSQADAAVLIGDIGMQVTPSPALIDIDLGQAWWELTGLPFYFAGWVAHDPAVLADAAPMLHEACTQGLARLADIAVEESARLALPVSRCYDYLATVMRYRTGEAERAGLAEFARRAARLGLL